MKLPPLIVSAGDPSGDRLGAELLAALRARGATFDASGIGGPLLRNEGLRAVASTESIAVMGFAEVLTHLGAIHRARNALRDLLGREPKAIFIPIDAPGLHLGLAREAHRLGRRVVYYVCPQIWAWNYKRVARLREDVDLTLVLFRFEEDILRRESVNVRWVGHPAGELQPDPALRDETRRAMGIPPETRLIALLPGSRKGEVSRHLGPMLDAAARLVAGAPGPFKVVVSDMGGVAGAARRSDVAAAWDAARPGVATGPIEELLQAADLALVASGTATLETGAIGVPFALVYRTSGLTYAIARRLVKVSRIGLVNIMLDEDVVPECIQDGATGAAIAAAAAPLLPAPDGVEEPFERVRQRRAFGRLRDILGGPGAADRAADALIEFAS